MFWLQSERKLSGVCCAMMEGFDPDNPLEFREAALIIQEVFGAPELCDIDLLR